MNGSRVLGLSIKKVERLLVHKIGKIKVTSKLSFSTTTLKCLTNNNVNKLLETKKITPLLQRFSSDFVLPPSAYDLARGAYVPEKSQIQEKITVRNENGLCILVLPLYSRNEVCRFVIKPLMHTLNDFIMHVKAEDPGIEKIKAYSMNGQLICNTTACSNLLKEDFILQLNALNYHIHLDNLDFSSPYLSDETQKGLVAQLYLAMNSREIYVKRQEKLLQRLEELQYELEPLEKSLGDIKELAHRKARIAAWGGLSLMCLLCGMLARLTWWEYSWDIMEPVTYFVTQSFIITFYGYYIITNKEYYYPTVYSRFVVNQIHRICERGGFDLIRYNYLCDEAARIKYDLRRLQDPLKLQLHPHHLERDVKPLM